MLWFAQMIGLVVPPSRRVVPARRMRLILVALLTILAATPLLVLRLPHAARPKVSTVTGYGQELLRCLATGEGPRSAPIPTRRTRTDVPPPPGAARWVFPVAPALPAAAHPDVRPVTVAVLDSGVEAIHPDLAGHVLPGADLLNPCGTAWTDPRGHGTAVAGVIASNAGLPRLVRILPVRVTFADGTASRLAIAAGIVWATRHGADVINVSLASRVPSRLERAAVRYAAARDVIVVAAAGNEPDTASRYPAALPDVVAVSAVDSGGRLAGFAARADYARAVAPGVDVPVPHPAGGHIAADGTSVAAPFVAAAAARLLAGNPDLTTRELRDWLRQAGWRVRPLPTIEPLRVELPQPAPRPQQGPW